MTADPDDIRLTSEPDLDEQMPWPIGLRH